MIAEFLELDKTLAQDLLALYAVELRERYMTACEVPECMACQSRRIEGKEKFRDFRHKLAALVNESNELHAFVMNYPFEVK